MHFPGKQADHQIVSQQAIRNDAWSILYSRCEFKCCLLQNNTQRWRKYVCAIGEFKNNYFLLKYTTKKKKKKLCKTDDKKERKMERKNC